MLTASPGASRVRRNAPDATPSTSSRARSSRRTQKVTTRGAFYGVTAIVSADQSNCGRSTEGFRFNVRVETPMYRRGATK